MSHSVRIYTDGSVYPNPGFGGWAAVLKSGAHEREISGASEGATTNIRMELTAVIEALKLLKPEKTSEVVIVTDSEYVANGVNNWLRQWLGMSDNDLNWAASRVKNFDLWFVMLGLARTYPKLSANWVRGHGKECVENIRADELAGLARKNVWEGVDFKTWLAEQ